jgi:molecular chaperone GrpE (heat shock protein)
MYKQMIPADVIAREVQFGGAARAVNHRAPRHEVSTAQMAEAAPNLAVALQEQLADERERYVRLAADFDNFKRRTTQELDRRATAQKDALVRDLLAVIDNFERGGGFDGTHV